MSSPRSTRSRSAKPHPPGDAPGPVVAVTGAASGVGALLTERLAASEEIKQVIAIDERRGEVSEALWHILDVRDPAIADKLRGAGPCVVASGARPRPGDRPRRPHRATTCAAPRPC